MEERDEISSVISMRPECAFIRNRDPTFPGHDDTQKREKTISPTTTARKEKEKEGRNKREVPGLNKIFCQK